MENLLDEVHAFWRVALPVDRIASLEAECLRLRLEIPSNFAWQLRPKCPFQSFPLASDLPGFGSKRPVHIMCWHIYPNHKSLYIETLRKGGNLKNSTKPIVKEFFDKATWTLTYVVYDENTKDAIIIDPVWDYDPAASKLSTTSAEAVLGFVELHDLKVHYILETHAHADHVSGSQVLKQKLPKAKVGIGAKITDVQNVFKGVFNLDPEFKTDGSQFDMLIEEGRPLEAGQGAVCARNSCLKQAKKRAVRGGQLRSHTTRSHRF